MPTLGWDIGGVNTKVAMVRDGALAAIRQAPFELQRAPRRLVPLLRELADAIGAPPSATHAVTMTAELSQMFRTKREGVAFVLDAVEAAFPDAAIRVFTTRGDFLTPDRARTEPLAVAAANWLAAATIVARDHPDALFVDIGSTTTDLIPIAGGRVVAEGRTDPERLASGELVYTGAVRTPVEAVTSHVPVRGRMAGVSAEGFALTGDVHLWRGSLEPADYSAATPDGRPATREFARERLARVVCADREMLDDDDVSRIADAVAEAQIERIAIAMRQAAGRHAAIRQVVATGAGAFLAEAAARAAAFDFVGLPQRLGAEASRCAPAAAVALLLSERQPGAERRRASGGDTTETRAATEPVGTRSDAPPSCVEVVVKVGGALLADAAAFEAALAAIEAWSAGHRILVVPGGGPFADAVREVDRRMGLGDDEAHWMAILGMDQYAHAVAARLPRATIVRGRGDIARALECGLVPVLAPFEWLRQDDALPHSWDVTSDSIAAWVAGAIGAAHLILVKAPGASGPDALDAAFTRVLPSTVRHTVVAADRLAAGKPPLDASRVGGALQRWAPQAS